MDLSKMTARARHYVTADGKPGGAPHQQFVTDAEGNALWEDRTHYAHAGLVDILPETTVTLGSDDPMAPIMEPLLTSLVAGNEYTVTYNGVEYVCVAQALEDNGAVVTMLGNVSSATGGGDTGEPFVIAEYPPEYVEMFGTRVVLILFAGTTNATVKITAEVEDVKKIDDKFLDLTAKRVYTDAVVGSDSIYAYIYRDPELTDKMPFAEAYEILVKYGGKICAQTSTQTLEEYHLFTPMLVTPLATVSTFYVALTDGNELQRFTLYCADTILD